MGNHLLQLKLFSIYVPLQNPSSNRTFGLKLTVKLHLISLGLHVAGDVLATINTGNTKWGQSNRKLHLKLTETLHWRLVRLILYDTQIQVENSHLLLLIS